MRHFCDFCFTHYDSRHTCSASASSSSFFMIYAEQGNSPTVRHATEAAAMKEAERLAGLNPGKVFHVLERKGSVKTAPLQFIWD
jgi:hypothetical protein